MLTSPPLPAIPRLLRYACLFSYIALLSLATAQTCYFPKGNEAVGHVPCGNGNGTVQSCCQPGSTCLTTGLCLLVADTGLNTGSCTNAAWSKDSGCFQPCVNILGPVDNESVLFRCGGHNWCCNRGGNGTSCCGNGGRNLFRLEEPSRVQNGTLNFADGYTLTATADLVSAPANQSLASPAPITTSCVAASTEEAGNDNKVTAVGAGVGVGVGVPLLAALIGVLYLWRKERKVVKVLQTKLAAQQNEHQRKQMGEAPAPEYVDHHIPHELDNPARYAKELPDQSPRSRGL